MPFPGQAGHELVQLLRLARAEDERGPAIGESDRHRPPEAAGGAGQEHRLALEPHASNLPTPEPELRERSDGPNPRRRSSTAVGRTRQPSTGHRSNRLGPMKLYVCWGTFQTPRPGGHPCHNAHQALRMAGHEPEVVKVRGLGVGPRFLHLMTERTARGRGAFRDNGGCRSSSPTMARWWSTRAGSSSGRRRTRPPEPARRSPSLGRRASHATAPGDSRDHTRERGNLQGFEARVANL